MSTETGGSEHRLRRTWEQPSDAISFFSDSVQVTTAQEIWVQFYETIPGAPGPGGTVEEARSRLRATVILTKVHAARLGKLLTDAAAKGLA